LFCGLLVHLAEALALDYGYIDAHTSGFEAALAQGAVRCARLAGTARQPASRKGTSRASSSFSARTMRVVTCYSQGVNQSAQGTDKVNAIINCHLATGRIGKPGNGAVLAHRASPTRWADARSAGLANQLAAHMGFSAPEVRSRRPLLARIEDGDARRLEGRADVRRHRARRIKALWVMATNPAVSLPRAGAMRAALEELDLFVVSENCHRTTP
jgi:assimilatory nitrate reductase catalytic subunit